MAIDTEAKRRSVTNIITRMGLGLLNGSGVDANERPNTSFIYGFLNYSGALPVPLANLMVLYPIQPQALSNMDVYQKDNREYEQVQKSGELWRHEIVSLRFRIFGKATAQTFYNFHVTNRNSIVILNIPGVQPFIRSNESNNVRILDLGQPQQITPLNYEITVTYRNVLRTATT